VVETTRSGEQTQSIRCLIPGQPPGEHDLRVLVRPMGYAIPGRNYSGRLVGTASSQNSVLFPSIFQIDTITPTRGSMAGGTVVTIAGVGFAAEVSRNLVTVGHGECDVQSASPTEIVCVTRREHARFIAAAYLDKPTEASLVVSVSVRNLQVYNSIMFVQPLSILCVQFTAFANDCCVV
jgi:hypothetical protein